MKIVVYGPVCRFSKHVPYFVPVTWLNRVNPPFFSITFHALITDRFLFKQNFQHQFASVSACLNYNEINFFCHQMLVLVNWCILRQVLVFAHEIIVSIINIGQKYQYKQCRPRSYCFLEAVLKRSLIWILNVCKYFYIPYISYQICQ